MKREFDAPATMLWRRIDAPGHDICRLVKLGDGWRLSGCTIFRHAKGPSRLDYAVLCDASWRTASGKVRGHLGGHAVNHVIAHTASTWTLDGAEAPGLDHLVDLDFSFTPATNILQIRRAAFNDGETVKLPAAWLDIDAGRLTELAQTYRPLGPNAFWYEAPGVGYAGRLELASSGFVRIYPGLWEEEPPAYK